MAISWDVEISNVNLASKRGDVTVVRTNDQSALEPRRYSLPNTPLETPQQRLKVLDTIKEWDDAFVAKEAAANVFIDTLETTAKTNLENWELSR